MGEQHDYESNETSQKSAGLYGLLFVIGLWVTFVVFGHFQYRPPAPLSNEDVGEFEFAAGRAEPILWSLVGDGIPHPAGSEQNKVVRQRIVAMLEGWDYEVTEQTTSNHIWRNESEEEVPLVNLMTRIPGTQPGPAVMLCAHYDSNTGPGASDDGIGVSALLEIARMMIQMPQPRNDVIFLITDGEEMGLLGADKWAQEHPWANDVGVAINVEARGTTGPSSMFETSEDSKWLVDLLAKHVTRPFASSLYYEIYKLLPNDTDFTIFKKAGMQGFNFAFIGDVKNYHTLNDNYENADRGCLQHHGQNAWALLQPLSETDLANTPKGRAVYFDLFGRMIVSWPEPWSLVLSAILMFALLFLAAFCFRGTDQAAWANVPIALVAVLIQITAIVFLISILGMLLKQDQRFEVPWLPSPVPVVLVFWTAAVCCASFLANVVSGFTKPTTVWFAVSFVWAILAIVSSLFVSGASYLFLVPVASSVAAGMIGLVIARKGRQFAVFSMAIAVGLIWLPYERPFYDAIGFKMTSFIGVRIALTLSALFPLLVALPKTTSRNVGWVCLAGSMACAIAAVFLNPLP